MKLFCVVLLLSFFCSQTKANDTSAGCGENIYIPVVIILCQALLLSVAVNVYLICMTRYRERCQDFYDDYITVCCSCDKPNEPERADEQVEADIQYSAHSVSSESRECEGQTEASPTDCVYSAVKHTKIRDTTS